MIKFDKLRLAVGVLACVAAASATAAYPEKVVRVIVPYPAGGTQDAMIRAFSERFVKMTGQNLVVENKAGAAGVVGMQEVARSPGDGYTLGLANNGMVITPLINSGVASFDLGRDLAPVTMVASGPLVMFSHPRVPGNDAVALINHAKAQPNGLTYSSTGPGGLGHLANELLAQRTGAKLNHIPYKGNAPAMLAVLAGEVDFIVSTSSDTAMQNVAVKKMKILAVSTRNPSPLFPGIGTIAAAAPGFDVAVWLALVAPRSTPADLVGYLNRTFTTIINDAETKKRYEPFGLVPGASTPANVTEQIQKELTTWAPIVKERGIKVE